MREIALAYLDKTRPVLVLTRELARPAMTKVTVAPVTTTIKGLSSELRLDVRNGLEVECVASLDNVMTIPTTALGRTIGYLTEAQEAELARSIILAFDLDVSIH